MRKVREDSRIKVIKNIVRGYVCRLGIDIQESIRRKVEILRGDRVQGAKQQSVREKSESMQITAL